VDFISLTDIARYKDKERSDYILQNWMRSRETIEFLGLWERINNDNFNSIEFDGIKMQAGVNSFILTPKRWIEKTSAIGIISKAGRYGGTYAHKDIAFEFASWISAEFKLFLIKEHLVPQIVSKPKESFIYANEADLLNVALFGMIAKEWREANKDKEGNVRDYASVEQLIVLSNLESINAELIKQNLPQNERLVRLNQTAIA
ncbi:MAG: KilA-N domain-containing protein, partial [Sulfurimonas sp.]|nr:KilA-N domain-containing protein [Sulfurimonas sp.]